MLYDAFICHAGEDKDDLVRPLAEMLRSHHLEVWYDEFTLSVGDSLRRAIDKGLANSRFGIVVLSPDFFAKGWPQRELDGLVSREIDEERQIILPVWHKISRSEIIRHSPPLADVFAVRSDRGLDEVCKQLLRKIRPDDSPLIIARDELIAWGVQPPVISDEWWLDVVEASNRVPPIGARIPESVSWGPWAFPLAEGAVGEMRGINLAWTALQMRWTAFAEEHRVCQLTHPDIVHEFIRTMPGLREMCLDYPDILAHYAPQLMLREFSGDFADAFDTLLLESEAQCIANRKYNFSTGTAVTIDGNSPLCDESVALRHDTFGNYKARLVANVFVRGHLWGVSHGFFSDFDCLVWIVSGQSAWLPPKARAFLTDGLSECLPRATMDMDWKSAFVQRLMKSRSEKTFKLTRASRDEWRAMVAVALKKLGNETDPVNEIADAILGLGVIEKYFEFQRERKRG